MKAKEFEKSRKLAIHYHLGLLQKESQASLDNYFLSLVSHSRKLTNDIDHIISWAFWNLSYARYQHLLEIVKDSLYLNPEPLKKGEIRKLPEFTSNMGHLGYLVSYISFYSQFDPAREIELWPATAPNQFCMSLILEQSPLKIHISREIPAREKMSFYEKDSLALSRCSEKVWRIEHCSAPFATQEFPEVSNSNRFTLKFPNDLSQECINRLHSIGFDSSKWFVILHIRGPKDNDLTRSQVRDAQIGRYSEFCRIIKDLGGQVVRMGGKTFIPLTENYPAIDYAHSQVASDDLDCWLWANCRWWTGNSNGASIAAYAFGARRLISDQWYWDNVGPTNDCYMPRLLLEKSVALGINETINHELSRNMDNRKFMENGLQVESVPDNQLGQAALDMYDLTNVEYESQTKTIESQALHPIEASFNSALRNSRKGEFMRIPNSYLKYLEEKLT